VQSCSGLYIDGVQILCVYEGGLVAWAWGRMHARSMGSCWCDGYDVEDMRSCGHGVGARGSKATIYALVLDFRPRDSLNDEI
jgi:hypothetical protein